MLFVAYYAFALIVLSLHVSGFLLRYNMTWLMDVLVTTVFPAALFL